MVLKEGHLSPGQVVSLDQYECTIRGRLPHTRGREKLHERYCGGTIGVDHASGKIFLSHQVSLRAHDDTVRSKLQWEQDAHLHGIKILQYHSDNGVFKSNEFKTSLQLHNQSLTFSGSGAHHQNGVAERGIRTVCDIARTCLLHAALHWPDCVDESLWPFAMDYAMHIYNNTPQITTGLTPNEIFYSVRNDTSKLLTRLHVWGCPSYVLDPTLQDGKKIPKWKPRSRQGQFLGISRVH